MLAALLLAATLTIEDYATMPHVSAPRWSPDGTRIAYVLTKADLTRSAYDSDVWLIDASGANDRRLTVSPGTDANPKWSPDGTRIAFLSDRGGRTAIHLIDVRGGEARGLTDDATPVRDFEWSPDGRSIAYLRMDEVPEEEEKRKKEKDDARVAGTGERHVHLHLADVATGKVRRLTSGAFSIFSLSWSPDGTTIAFDSGPGTGFDDLYRTDVYTIRVGDAQPEPRPIVVRSGLDRGPRFSPDGKWIAFVSTGGLAHWLGEHDVHVVPAGGGEPRDISSGSYGRTPERIEWSGDSKSLWLEGPLDIATQLFRIAMDGTLTEVTNAAVVATDADALGNKVVYVGQSLTEPPELFVMDGPRGTARRLTKHNEAWRSRELGETRVIRWKNPEDGLEIEGLLTLPVGYQAGQRVPLLTFVHGGPASRFDLGFLGYLGHVYAPQALAARGFAVLRPNPRGTGGYGLKFRKANVGDWAGMDWVDINAGIDKVIADGIADPKRLGLMGWSYGGYIAAWAIGHSDRFGAISVGAAIVDLLSYHGTSDIRGFIPSYFWRTVDPDCPSSAACYAGALELLRERSPAWNLKKTGAKVLIQHGELDDRVPPSQGMLLYRLLDELGVDVTLVLYPRTPHGAREPKLRMDVARRNMELFVGALMK